jgi:hypothetical protein
MIVMGLLSAAVYFGGIGFVHQVTLNDADSELSRKNDKTGVLIFVIVVSVFYLFYWIFDIYLGFTLAGFFIIVFVIIANFGCAWLALVLGNREALLRGSNASNTRATVQDSRAIKD